MRVPPSVNPRQNISMEVSGQVKSFPFFDEGVSLVRAVFDKDSYYVGETAHVECFVNNTQCSQTIRCLEIKIRRKIWGKNNLGQTTSDRIVINKEFEGIKNGMQGLIRLDCPILLNEDALVFIERYQTKFLSFPPHELDDLKLQSTPTVESFRFNCSYFIEIHVCYEGSFKRHTLNALSLPIKVYRSISRAQIPTLPQPVIQSAGG